MTSHSPGLYIMAYTTHRSIIITAVSLILTLNAFTAAQVKKDPLHPTGSVAKTRSDSLAAKAVITATDTSRNVKLSPGAVNRTVKPVADSSTAGIDTSAADTAAHDTTVSKKRQEITDTVHYEADRIDYDAENRILTLTGKSSVKYQNLTLLADTIVYFINDNLFTASGLPQLMEGSDTTIGDYMAYNIKTRRGRVRYATTHIDDAYFSGHRIVMTKGNQLYVNQGDYTTCALADTPDYFFYGRDIKIVPNDKIVSRPVVLNIGDAPVAVLPYFIFPTERKRRSGILTPAWGGHPTSGGYVDNVGYYYVPNDYVDFTAYSRIQEFRDFVINVSSRYALRYWLNGALSARYAINSDFLQRSSQWALDYAHSQNLTPDGLTRLAGNGSLVSQKNFYERFSEDTTELREQNLTANMSLSHTFQKINASGTIVWNRSHNLVKDSIDENIPSVDFNLSPRPLIPQSELVESGIEEPAWYNNIYWGYSARGVVKHTGPARDPEGFFNEKTFHPGATNSININAPQKLLKYITVNPNFNASASGFYGYMDTAVSDTGIDYDTVRYQVANPSRDTRYTDYELLQIDTTFPDSFGFTDTIYTVTKRSKPIKTLIHQKHDAPAGTYSWSTGVSLQTNLYGLFPFRLFNFDGIRHTLTPSISYTYNPEIDLDKMFYPIGISPDPGRLRQQLVGISLSNQFQGKRTRGTGTKGEKPQVDKFTILTAGLSTSYNFEGKERKWSDLSVNASTAYNILGVNYSSIFWLYDEDNALSAPILEQFSVSLSAGSLGARGSLWGGDRLVLDSIQPYNPLKYYNAGPQSWQFNFTPAYTFSMRRLSPTDVFVPTKTYNLSASASLNFTRSWSVRWSGNYNFVQDQMVQNSINLHCDAECWEMRFEWRPERLNPGYYFLINIKKIPEIKWEQRP